MFTWLLIRKIEEWNSFGVGMWSAKRAFYFEPLVILFIGKSSISHEKSEIKSPNGNSEQ